MVTGVLRVRRLLAPSSGGSAAPPELSKDGPTLEGLFRTPSFPGCGGCEQGTLPFPGCGGCERGVLTEDDGVKGLSRDGARIGRPPEISRPTLFVTVEPNWPTTPAVSLIERCVKIGIDWL